jgi:hypothetical protein
MTMTHSTKGEKEMYPYRVWHTQRARVLYENGQKEKKTKRDCLVFLLTDEGIRPLNFEIWTYRIASTDYSRSLYRAIQRGDIIIRTKGPMGSAAASYVTNYDSFELERNFSIANWRHQGYFVHECTHAVIDMMNIGHHSAHEDEAVAYLAEALFLEASRRRPLGDDPIRAVSHRIAREILAAPQKKVSDIDAENLKNEVAKHPAYRSIGSYNSNRFERRWYEDVLRRW